MIDFIIINKGVIGQTELNIREFNSDQSVYEVIRIIDGIALFLEDHYSRLITSARIGGLQFEMKLSEFRRNINELGVINKRLNGNVKFVLIKGEPENRWLFSFIPHKYPSINDYRLGVATGLLFAERENPNAKIIQNTIRESANKMIAEQKFFEVLIVDQNGIVTEGSRSNVFFVKDNRFYTAPDSKVLVGVTRQKVLECLSRLGFQIIEVAVLASEISSFDAVFLTGTSPNILPVNCIGTIQFPANNCFVEQLIEKYNSVIEMYLDERKN